MIKLFCPSNSDQSLYLCLLRILLSAILLIAGFLHLLNPMVFMPSIPKFLPFPIEIIYLTGILEIILSLGLLFQKTRNFSAVTTAIYFTLLIPVHLYVSVYKIEIFGITSSVILWGRTLFQLVFIYWAYAVR